MKSSSARNIAGVYAGSLIVALGILLITNTVLDQLKPVLYYTAMAFELLMIIGGLWLIAKRPEASRNIALGVTMSMVSFGLLEIVVISTWLFSVDLRERQNFFFEFHEPDPQLGIKARSGLKNFLFSRRDIDFSMIVDTDKYGFRNSDDDYRQASIYFLGDSFTWAYGVDRGKSFYGLIGAELDEPVICLGVGGYGMEQYAIVTQKILREHSPSTIVLNVFANDVIEVTPPETLTDLYRARGWDQYREISYYDRSLTAFLGKQIKRMAGRGGGVGPNMNSVQIENGLTLFESFFGTSPDYFTSSFNVEIERIFSEIIDFVTEKDINLLVFMFPSKESTYKEHYLRAFPGDYLTIEETAYARFCDIAEQKNVVCVDLTPVFRRRSEDEIMYFNEDGHWNELGNEIAAKEILTYLRPTRGNELALSTTP